MGGGGEEEAGRVGEEVFREYGVEGWGWRGMGMMEADRSRSRAGGIDYIGQEAKREVIEAVGWVRGSDAPGV